MIGIGTGARRRRGVQGPPAGALAYSSFANNFHYAGGASRSLIQVWGQSAAYGGTFVDDDVTSRGLHDSAALGACYPVMSRTYSAALLASGFSAVITVLTGATEAFDLDTADAPAFTDERFALWATTGNMASRRGTGAGDFASGDSLPASTLTKVGFTVSATAISMAQRGGSVFTKTFGALTNAPNDIALSGPTGYMTEIAIYSAMSGAALLALL